MTDDELARQVATLFAERVTGLAAGGARFRCAVPGGSVATRVFPILVGLPLPWSAIDLFLADERFVPPGDPESNQRAVRELWLDRLGGAAPWFHAMETEGLSPGAAAQRAAARLLAVAGTPPVLDLAILGVGPDGHVASLFPGATEWRRSREWVIAVRGAPKPPPVRLSLGLATLAVAREIWFVAFGPEKARVIADAQADPSSPLPVAVVARSGPRVRWFAHAPVSAS